MKGEISIMSNVVFFNTYKLRDGASVPDFLLAAENLINGYISKQEGYISCQILIDGDTWSDVETFNTMDNLNAFLEASKNDMNELAEKFFAFLDCDTCQSKIYSVEKSY